MQRIHFLLFTAFLFSLGSCGEHSHDHEGDHSHDHEGHQHSQDNMHTHSLAKDHHSYASPNDVRVSHLEWTASVDFDTKVISATANWDLNRISDAQQVIFDIHDVEIDNVTDEHGNELRFKVGSDDQYLGQSLTIDLEEKSNRVAIAYVTNPSAEALLWVEGEKPFLFSQSQAILGRTWIPCQDSPGVRFTYNAEVSVPKDLLALMSAENPQEKNQSGVYNFKMEQPIPSYLLALAVGDVAFRSIGERTGVYATPQLIDAAENEFQDMDDMLVAAEKLYGEYVWGRYDLLILPPAFPFGGMENPRLTFATPTIIAGDRSLTSLVAHELAHSWSGNLVTNSTWDDFWLNEGFTVYFEQRIMEAVYGKEYAEMLASLSFQGLVQEVAEISAENPADTHLKLNLKGRSPDDGMSAIAYDKGYMFLRLLEETVGRERFDGFLKNYFGSNSFQVMDTEQFIAYLKENLLSADELASVKLEEWIYGRGLPANTPKIASDKIAKVDALVAEWSAGKVATATIPWKEWSYQEKYRFLKNIDAEVSPSQLGELDSTFGVNDTGNNEVLFAWLEQAILHGYEPAYNKVEAFLISVGRRKFLTPLYKAMLEKDNREMANNIYAKARSHYHAVAVQTMDELLSFEASDNG